MLVVFQRHWTAIAGMDHQLAAYSVTLFRRVWVGNSNNGAAHGNTIWNYDLVPLCIPEGCETKRDALYPGFDDPIRSIHADGIPHAHRL